MRRVNSFLPIHRVADPALAQSLSASDILERIGALKAFGNAIVPQVAAEVIRAFMDCIPAPPPRQSRNKENSND